MACLMRHILHNNIFEFNGHHFAQVKGTAMGTRMAPAYAGLFMARLEVDFLEAQDEDTRYGRGFWVSLIFRPLQITPRRSRIFPKRHQSVNLRSLSFTQNCSETRKESSIVRISQDFHLSRAHNSLSTAGRMLKLVKNIGIAYSYKMKDHFGVVTPQAALKHGMASFHRIYRRGLRVY